MLLTPDTREVVSGVLTQVAKDIAYDLGTDYGLSLDVVDTINLDVPYPIVDENMDTKDTTGVAYGCVVFSRQADSFGYFGYSYSFRIETSFDGSWEHDINVSQYL